MKIAAVVLIAGVTMLPATAGAQERAGNAALGALAGAVVFGPVGAVAGAAVGYTAGHGIARDWGLHRSRPARRVRKTHDQ
jgi:uncharacterized membrane protein YdjX (TVP38/TMEM64 family)